MQNDKIKPLLGLIGVSLAGLVLLAILIFFFSFLCVEFSSWHLKKGLNESVIKARSTAIEVNLIGTAIDKYPGYITYLKTIKAK